MTETNIIAEIDSSKVLRVTINREANRNALSLSVLNSLRDTFRKHAGDDSIRLVTLRGAGDKAFAAGGDLKEFSAFRTEEDATRMVTVGKRALDTIRTFPAPVVAFINGLALGGGAELSVACDMRFASASAKIGFIHSRLAITSAWGGGTDLIDLVGAAKAMQLMARTELLTAQEAKNTGLVSDCSQAVEDAGVAFDEFISTMIEKPAHVLRAIKSLTLRRRRMVHAELGELESSNHVQAWIHEDHWDAVQSLYGDKHK